MVFVKGTCREMGQTARDSVRSIEDYRDYLLLLARLQLGSRPPGEGRRFGRRAAGDPPRSSEPGAVPGWERGRVAAVAASDPRQRPGGAVRRFDTQARDRSRERSLEGELERSSSRLQSLLVADQTSPSERVVRGEELLGLAHAIARLPEDQRRVVELHYLRGLTVADVANEIGRSRPAAVGLLFRAEAAARAAARLRGVRPWTVNSAANPSGRTGETRSCSTMSKRSNKEDSRTGVSFWRRIADLRRELEAFLDGHDEVARLDGALSRRGGERWLCASEPAARGAGWSLAGNWRTGRLSSFARGGPGRDGHCLRG